MKLTELKEKYGIVVRPKYYDAKWIRTYRSATPKGKLLFDLDIEKNLNTGKDEYRIYGPYVRRRTLHSIQEVDEFLSGFKLDDVKDVVLSDEEIVKYLGRQLGYRSLKLKDITNTRYIKWKSSIELHNDDKMFPYNQFMEGEGHQDDDYSLGTIMMLLPDFEEWLIKHEATKMKRPKPIRTTSYYD